MTDSIIVTFEKFYNELAQITIDDELLLSDDNMMMVMEIYQMIFKDYNKFISDKNNIESVYQQELPEGTKVKKLTKEVYPLALIDDEQQTLVRQLYLSMANKMLNFIFSLQVNGKGLSNKIMNGIDEHAEVIFENIIAFINNNEDMDKMMWNQEIFNDAKNEIKLEIIRARFKPSGIKDLGVCKRCNSKELLFTEVQLRSADEPSSFRVVCRDCDFKWTMK